MANFTAVTAKDFKVAQIVPVSHLDDISGNHYHMCLAHLVAQSDVYAKFYETMSKIGRFVLMDNGAAEHAQLDTKTLLEMYERIHPTEIVIPDTLCDKDDTIRKAHEFIEAHSNLPYRFMAVPQGNSVNEWCKCASELIAGYPRIDTIGISKFLNIASGDPYARFAAANYVWEISQRFDHPVEVHLLGCDEGPKIVREIHMEVPNVRGCDSAFAYIATKAGIEISEDTKRPAGEIDFLNDAPLSATVRNMHRFEEAAGVGSQFNAALWQ